MRETKREGSILCVKKMDIPDQGNPREEGYHGEDPGYRKMCPIQSGGLVDRLDRARDLGHGQAKESLGSGNELNANVGGEV